MYEKNVHDGGGCKYKNPMSYLNPDIGGGTI